MLIKGIYLEASNNILLFGPDDKMFYKRLLLTQSGESRELTKTTSKWVEAKIIQSNS